MRPTPDQTFLLIAKAFAARTTCVRRAVGCVLVDKYGEVSGTGYNGAPPGMDHCIDMPCPGATLPSGTGLDLCQAIHAEANALLQCKDPHNLQTCYVTTAPCMGCVKLLARTSVERIVFIEDYVQDATMSYWFASGKAQGLERVWQKIASWYDIVDHL